MKSIIGNLSQWKKIGILTAVAASLAVLFSLLAGKKEPIKIGAILSLSGPGSHVVDVKNGMMLAADEVNSRGGINGRKIKLIIEDSETDIEQGKKAFNKIESAHHPLLYVSTLSSVSMALSPLAKENAVVLIGLVASDPKLTGQNQWVFRYYTTAQYEVQSIMYLLQKELEVKALGILYLNDEYGLSVFGLLKKDFEAVGGTVRAKPFEKKQSDFKEQIAKLKAMEAIYVVGYASHLKGVLQQLRKENFRGFKLGSSGILNLAVAIPEVDGVYLAAPIIYNPHFLFAKDAREKYEGRYKKDFNHYAANGYDLVKLMANLLEDKKISRDNVKRLLEGGFIHPGVFGNLEVKQGERDIIIPLYPAQIVNGKIKYLR